jgi:hypothetical protein
LEVSSPTEELGIDQQEWEQFDQENWENRGARSGVIKHGWEILDGFSIAISDYWRVYHHFIPQSISQLYSRGWMSGVYHNYIPPYPNDNDFNIFHKTLPHN